MFTVESVESMRYCFASGWSRWIYLGMMYEGEVCVVYGWRRWEFVG